MVMSAGSHMGKVRRFNEDGYYISEGNFEYMVVADGMGGHNGGQTASKTAIESVKMYLTDSRFVSEYDVEKCLEECIELTNNTVYKKASMNDELAGMGTTLVIFCKDGDKGYVANVGDSRCYLIRDNEIQQITKDHSVVQELYDKGQIGRDDMKNHPNKNIITRAIGTNYNVKCDIFEIHVNENDGIVLCTDGLSNMVDDEEILNIYLNAPDTDACVKELIEKANNAGGTDNITVAVAKL